MTYDQALAYLDSFVNYEKERSFVYPEALKLDRMRRLAKELGNPQNAYESILIAGSKGKGSTAAFVSSILRMENLKVGLYTSPHLVDVRERIQVNGLWINEARFTEFMGRLRKMMDEHFWKKDPPTYFEVLTAMAFVHFKEMKVQVAVLEVGLGGLYDSTNIAPAKVVGLTPIGLEHTDKLGRTVAKIAVQKCGVIKGREIVVSAPQSPEAMNVIHEAAGDREATLFRVGKEITIFERDHQEDGQKMDVRTPWGNFYDLEVHLRGAHQIENAAQAAGLAMALTKKTRLTVSESAVRQGLADARWPGRLEKISERPRILLDGAHTVDSIRKMLEGIKRHFRFSDLIVVFACSADKDAKGMLEAVVPECQCVIITQFEGPRAMPCRELAQRVPAETTEVFVEQDNHLALAKARSLAGPDDLILICGSLFLVSELRTALIEGI